MNRGEASFILANIDRRVCDDELNEALDMAIKALDQEPRKITLEDVKGYCKPRYLTIISNELLYELTHPKIKALEQEPKTGHCKDCKWWKDSDGTYCRGIHTESKCPINRKEVYEGNGYCYMFEPQGI